MKRYPFSTSLVAGMVMFNVGGARSGRDLYFQLAETIGNDDKINARVITLANWRDLGPRGCILVEIDQLHYAYDIDGRGPLTFFQKS